ncbi:MAG: outer membrane beta-barrel protein [Prevotellaceae bacterium]|nr:outer membrane beta-barrel protein [Prevotellaceae bacterium]
MKKILLTLTGLLCLTIGVQAQKKEKKQQLYIRMNVVDYLTREAVDSVRCSLLRSDSTEVKSEMVRKERWGTTCQMRIDSVGSYLIKYEAPEYQVRYIPFELKRFHKFEIHRKLKDVALKRLPKKREVVLDEVVVTASKVKFYMDGDTLTYNADAFELPEGSMLNALIKKLPGVELKKGGEITVNGKRVDVMMLNGKDFFNSDRELILDNLPSYMVKKVQSYDRVPDKYKNTSMAEHVEKESVLNINLKREYAKSWVSNVEVGAGSDSRRLGRLFGMRFTDKSRLSIFGNTNNLNDDRKPGEQGDWTPLQQSKGLMTLYDLGIEGSYQHEKDGNRVDYNGSGRLKYTDSENDSHSVSESFLESGNTFGRSVSSSFGKNLELSLNNRLYLLSERTVLGLKHINVNIYNSMRYGDRRNGGHSANATFLEDISEKFGDNWTDSILNPNAGALLRKYAITRNLTQAKNDGRTLLSNTWASIWAVPKYNDRVGINIDLMHDYNEDKSDDFDHYLLEYPQKGSGQNDRRNRYDASKSNTQTYYVEGLLCYRLGKNRNHEIKGGMKYQHSRVKNDRSLYLLNNLKDFDGELGTLPSMELMEEAMDRDNSKWMNTKNDILTPQIQYQYDKWSEGGTLFFINASFGYSNKSHRLHYICNQTDTTLTDNKWAWETTLSCMLQNYQNGMNFRFTYQSNYTNAPLYQKVQVIDSSNPLYTAFGNPDLKDTRTHSIQTSYANRWGKTLFNTNMYMSITQNAIAMGTVYDRITGKTTAKPENVNGNWSLNFNSEVDFPLVKSDKWRLKVKPSYNYIHNVDLNGSKDSYTAEIVKATRSVVNTHNIGNGLRLTWRASDKMETSLKGDITYRHSTGNRENFATINVTDFNYGFATQIELPWNMQLATDLTMYQRRGYSSSDMNTDELLWNARLTKRFFKGNLLLQFDALDILGKLSNARHYVNAQGMTQTYYNVIPRYCMVRLTWRFNKKAKNGED